MRGGNGSLDKARAVPSMRTQVWVLRAHINAKRAWCLPACKSSAQKAENYHEQRQVRRKAFVFAYRLQPITDGCQGWSSKRILKQTKRHAVWWLPPRLVLS